MKICKFRGMVMKKICKVCGYTAENGKIIECPNCGSYSFETVQPEEKSGRFFKRW